MRSKSVASLLVAAGASLGIVDPSPGVAADVDIIFAADFLSGGALQWVRRHPQAGGATIALAPALVSAVQLSNGDADMTLYLQVPPALNHESEYPFFSALKTFGPSNPSPPGIGDCVIARGTIALLLGATELSPATITATAGADCGGSPLTPYVTTVADIASDADSMTPDNQPGPLAEALESVLVTLNPVKVIFSQVQYFWIAPPGLFNPPHVIVDPDLYQSFPATGSTLHITGVFDQSERNLPPPTVWYQLLPRNASDVVVLP